MPTPLPKDAAAKRAILYDDSAGEAALNGWADRFMEAERFGEALEFLERTRDPERLDRIREEGVRRGDTFLLLRVASIGRTPVPAETWRAAAERAVSLGKYLDAYRALLSSGDEEGAEALREKHMPDFKPFRPEGK